MTQSIFGYFAKSKYLKINGFCAATILVQVKGDSCHQIETIGHYVDRVVKLKHNV